MADAHSRLDANDEVTEASAASPMSGAAQAPSPWAPDATQAPAKAPSPVPGDGKPGKRSKPAPRHSKSSRRSDEASPLPEPPPWERPRPRSGRAGRRIVVVIGLVLAACALGGLIWWLRDGTQHARLAPGRSGAAGQAPGGLTNGQPSASASAGSPSPNPSDSLSATPGAGKKSSPESGRSNGTSTGSGGDSKGGSKGSTGTVASDPATAGARSALQSFLHGMGGSSPSACDNYTIESFMRQEYGSVSGCHQEATNMVSRHGSGTAAALRGVQIVSGRVDGTIVDIYMSNQSWPSGTASGGTLPSGYTIGLVDRVWKVTGVL